MYNLVELSEFGPIKMGSSYQFLTITLLSLLKYIKSDYVIGCYYTVIFCLLIRLNAFFYLIYFRTGHNIEKKK